MLPGFPKGCSITLSRTRMGWQKLGRAGTFSTIEDLLPGRAENHDSNPKNRGAGVSHACKRHRCISFSSPPKHFRSNIFNFQVLL